MKPKMKTVHYLIVLTTLLFASSCAPKVTFFVTKPPELPVENVDYISMGEFTEVLNQKIELPGKFANRRLNTGETLKPHIASFMSNRPSGDLVRAMIVAGLSKSNQYQLLKTGGQDSTFSGVIPDSSKTAVVSAKVKYFEYSIDDKEDINYPLLAKKKGNTLQEQLQLIAAKEAASMAARGAKKGFRVPTPYIESIAAMEVQFELVRMSNGDQIVPPQVFRSYFVKKWGGDEDTSHVPGPLKEYIVTTYQNDQSTFEQLKSKAADLELAFTDPDEFLAQGGKLKDNLTVPLNSLDIQKRLAQDIVDVYVRKISQYTVETILNVASGDAIAVNYIKGNAYELAINRLENIPRTEADSFNLGLAYESIAEFNQAGRYYSEALDKNPGNAIYQQSLERVQR